MHGSEKLTVGWLYVPAVCSGMLTVALLEKTLGIAWLLHTRHVTAFCHLDICKACSDAPCDGHVARDASNLDMSDDTVCP
jgi:hypothetical protein